MAKTKAELEYDCAKHQAIMDKVRVAKTEGDLLEAVELAVSAWEHIDGMMQYERRYAGRTEFKSIDSVDFVLKYAPVLFDFESLEKLAVLLKAQRRIDKNTTADLAANLDKANEVMWEARRLWDHLEQKPNSRQDDLRTVLGGAQDRWRWISETWEEIGIVQRTAEGGSYRLALATCMEDQARGKCPSCGVVGRAPRARFLDEITCPKCQGTGYFVFLHSSTN